MAWRNWSGIFCLRGMQNVHICKENSKYKPISIDLELPRRKTCCISGWFPLKSEVLFAQYFKPCSLCLWPFNFCPPAFLYKNIRNFMAKAAAPNLYVLMTLILWNFSAYGSIKRPKFMEKPAYSSRILRNVGYVCQILKSIYELQKHGKIWSCLMHNQDVSWRPQQWKQKSRL